MGLARSTYYDAPPRAADDTALVEAMAAVCDAFEAYGWRRVQAALRQRGVHGNHVACDDVQIALGQRFHIGVGGEPVVQ